LKTVNGQNLLGSGDIEAGKTYYAGSNVTISSDNTINAKDTTYSAGSNITIDSNNEISAQVESFDDKTLIK